MKGIQPLTLLLLSGCSVSPGDLWIQCAGYKFLCFWILIFRWGSFPEPHQSSYSQSYWGKADFHLCFYSVKDSVKVMLYEIFCRIFKEELQNCSKVCAIFLDEFVIEMKEQRNNIYQAPTVYQKQELCCSLSCNAVCSILYPFISSLLNELDLVRWKHKPTLFFSLCPLINHSQEKFTPAFNRISGMPL